LKRTTAQLAFLPTSTLLLLSLVAACLCFCSIPGQAQECGCVDCPLTIPNGTGVYELDYVIDGLVNNDLSGGQQICRVDLQFEHVRLSNLEVFLISPDRTDTVQLIGPFVSFGAGLGTPNTSWDVSFVPCFADGGLANPDPGIEEVWTNSDPDWATFFGGNFTGDYYPTMDNCLSEFDSGSANGNWTLQVVNNVPPAINSGRISSFQVVMCDETGFNCCFANGGQLNAPDTLGACLNSEELLLDNLRPTYSNNVSPDTDEYGYTYAVAENDVILEFQDIPDLRNFPTGEYRIKGLSYRLSDAPLPIQADGNLTLTSLLDTLDEVEPIFCGNLSSDDLLVIIKTPPPLVELDTTICQGDSLMVGNSTFFEAGTFVETISTADGFCDSILQINLTLLIPDTTVLQQVICDGETFTFNGEIYDSSGIYEIQYTSANGCDSLVQLELDVLPELSTTIDTTICAGRSVTVGNQSYTTTGSYPILLNSENGCDSLVTLNLDVRQFQAVVATPDILTCNDPTTLLDGSISSTGPGVTYEWTTTDGNIVSGAETIQATVDAPGSYTLTVRDLMFGCEATESVIVDADLDPPIANAGLPDTINCESEFVRLDPSNSTGNNPLAFQWLSPNNDSLIGSTPMATQAGIYTLIATDEVNGCVDSSSVQIVTAQDLPQINLPDSLSLVCTSGSIALDASNSVQGSQYIYEWSTTNGNIVTDNQQGLAQADRSGVYTLMITDTITGCSNSASVVVVDNCTPTAIAGTTHDTINCFQPSTTLTSIGSSVGNNFEYRWLNEMGDTLSTVADFTTNNGGIYVLWVRNTLFNTVATDTIVVTEDKASPLADAGSGFTITCTISEGTLDASASSQGALFDYQWLTFDGNFVNSDTSVQVIVDQPGLYTLEVTNRQNGCTASDNVAVQQMTTPPNICIDAPSQLLPCTANTLLLDATCSNPNPNNIFSWTTTDGQILTSPDQSNITVGQAGTYLLSVENTMTGCTATDSIVVQLENCELQVTVETPDTLTCSTLETILTANVTPPNNNLVISWSTTDGNLTGDPNQLTTTANAPGEYVLTIEDTLRATQTSITVEVIANAAAPVIDAGLSPTITCRDTVVQLSGSASSPAILSWTSDNGQAIENDSTLSPIVRDAGLYFLQATNPQNGCTALDSVEVLQNQMPPIVDAGPAQQLTCVDASVQLDGNNSSAGANFSYSWTATDGSIATGATTPTPTVTTPGTFVLIVENTENGCTASDSTTVSRDESLPQIDAGVDGQITCAEPEFRIQGQGPTDSVFDINWTAVDSGNIVSFDGPYQPLVDQPGRFALQVTNTSTGCVSFDTVQVADNAQGFELSVATPSELTCEVTNTSLVATVSPIDNYTFNWQSTEGNAIDNATSASANVSAPGTYTLTATNAETGCTENASVTVSANTTSPAAFAGPDTSLTCTRNTVILQGDSDQQNVGYTWTDADGNLAGNSTTLTVTTPNQYILTVRSLDNGCTAQDTVVINENRQIPTARIEIAAGTILNCYNEELLLNGQNSTPSADLQYRWINNSQAILSNTDKLAVSTPGTYTLRVTDRTNGCTNSTMVSIESDTETPSISIATPPVVPCDQPTVQLEAEIDNPTDVSFAWVNASGDTISTILTPQVTVGNYTLLATNQRNGCQTMQAVNVPSATPPTAAASNPDNARLTCEVNRITLSAEGSSTGNRFRFNWLRQDSILSEAPSFTATEAGWYVLQITDTLTNCTAIDSILVEGNPESIGAVDLAITPPNCTDDASGQIDILNVSGGMEPYLVSWNDRPFFQINSIERLEPGTYDLQLQDVNGCAWDTTVVLDSPTNLDIDLGEDLFINIGDSLQLEPLSNAKLFNIRWSSSDTLDCITCPVQTVQPTTETTYTVSAEDENGCVASDQITVRVDRSDLLYIPNIFSPNGDGQNDLFFINARPNAVEEIELFQIYDRWGTLIYQTENIQPDDPTQAWDGTYEGQELTPAVFVYFAKVKYRDGRTGIVEGDVTLVR